MHCYIEIIINHDSTYVSLINNQYNGKKEVFFHGSCMVNSVPTFTIKSIIHAGIYIFISATDPMGYTRNQQISDTLLKFNLAPEKLSGPERKVS